MTEKAFIKEWMADGQILAYRFPSMRRDDIDAWARDITAELETWPPEKRLRLIYDVRPAGNFLSAHALRTTREISQLRPDVSGRTAVLIASRFVAQVASVTIRGLGNRHRQRLIFYDESAAVAWLLENAP
jgi:hypothetical protein